MSARCSPESFGPMANPVPGISGCNHGVAAMSSTPSFCNSSAIAPKIVCAFFSFNRNSIATARRSGRRSKRFFGAICPAMTQCFTPRSVKAPINFESCPTRNQTMSSTRLASVGSVSPSNATATSRFTPERFASRASSSGNERLPAMRPRVSGGFMCSVRLRASLSKRGKGEKGKRSRHRLLSHLLLFPRPFRWSRLTSAATNQIGIFSASSSAG